MAHEQRSIEFQRRDRLPPFQRHSATSREAAIRAYDSARSLKAQCWRAFCGGDLTDEELWIAMKLIHRNIKDSTVRARRVELVREGLVEDSMERRPSRCGRKMVVWRVRT